MIGVVWAAQGQLACAVICRPELRLFQRSQLCVSHRHGCIWGYCSNYGPVHVLLELERNLCSDSFFLSCTPLAPYQIHFCVYVAGGVVSNKKLLEHKLRSRMYGWVG